MSCENYREALIDAAASGAVPSREVRSHLDDCASCRTTFAEEVQLFAAIDMSLRASANSEMPASLLPRVRAELNEKHVPQRSWISVGAALAAAAALLVMLAFFHDFGHDPTEPNPHVNSVAHHVSPAGIQSIPPTPAPYERGVPPAKSKIVRPVSTRPALKVEGFAALVLAGQKQAIDALLVSVQQGKVEADVLFAEKPTRTLEELQVVPLEISPIEVKPLADVSAESTSPNEKTKR